MAFYLSNLQAVHSPAQCFSRAPAPSSTEKKTNLQIQKRLEVLYFRPSLAWMRVC